VASAEALPFPDNSVDLVFVHDGLHHLADPFVALAEMARVARDAVSVNEPALAAATAVAVRLGLSESEEEAGNRVRRLSPEQVAVELERHGFRVRRSERYAMMYRHEPGRASRLLSRPGLYGMTRASLAAFNAVAGRSGNKLTVQAVRANRAPTGRASELGDSDS
jgi:SAM-dependent methyltransferase